MSKRNVYPPSPTAGVTFRLKQLKEEITAIKAPVSTSLHKE